MKGLQEVARLIIDQYVVEGSLKQINIPGFGLVQQPQMISDTQLLSADGNKYPDVANKHMDSSAK